MTLDRGGLSTEEITARVNAIIDREGIVVPAWPPERKALFKRLVMRVIRAARAEQAARQ